MTTFYTQRLLLATPSAVFDAFQNGNRLARWWGPAGFTNTFDLFEFHNGGRWQFNMIGPDGATYPNQSVFSLIDPDRQVVIDHVNQPHFQLKITLEPKNEGTLLHWSQVFADDSVGKAVADIVTVANEQNLDRLAAELRSGNGNT